MDAITKDTAALQSEVLDMLLEASKASSVLARGMGSEADIVKVNRVIEWGFRMAPHLSPWSPRPLEPTNPTNPTNGAN